MELQPGTIAHLQDYVASKINERGFSDETLHERLLLLTEEIGELVKACRKLSGMYTKENEATMHVGEELADCINMLFAVGVCLGVDMETEFIAKHKKVDERVYARTHGQQKTNPS